MEDELDVYVGNIVKFKALPGSGADNYAVKITEVLREEQTADGWNVIAGRN